MAEDQTLQCVICKTDFVFSADEQSFFVSLGYSRPKRCPNCRPRTRSQTGTTWTDGERVTSRVICDSCGTSTTVPFEPVEGRPIWCKPCFQQRRNQQD